MAPASRNIASSAISGLRWNYAGTLFSIVLSFAMSALLARILGPKPFGQVVIAMTIFGLVSMFVNGGFSQALIQQPNLTELQIRRTFTVQVGIGLVTAGFIVVCAPLLGRMFHDPSSTPVIRAMALMISIQSLGLVSAALLRREMRFKIVQFSGTAGYILGYICVGLPLALHNGGVWSLVAAYLTQAMVTSMLTYMASRHPVLPSFHLPDRSITHFGGVVVGSNLVNWGHANLDNLAASRLGPSALGLYGRACNLAYQPVTAFATTIQSVLLSSVARVQDRPELLRKLVLALLAIVFGLVGPAYVTLALIPQTTIVGLYGTKWVQSVPLMVPLALAMPFWGGMSLLGPVLAGIGKPQLEFWPQAISCGIAAIAFFTAAHYSILAIAWALFGIAAFRLIAIAAFIFRELAIPWRTAVAIVAKRLLLSAVFGLMIAAADHLLRQTVLGTGARLTVDVALATLLMLALVWTGANLIFGRLAVLFLLDYAPHLPVRYVQQLRMRLPRLEPNAAADAAPTA